MLDITKDQRTIASQREQIEELQETVLQLKQQVLLNESVFRGVTSLPMGWGLTASQRRIVGALYESDDGYLDRRALGVVAYAHQREGSNIDALLKVQMSHIRKRLQGTGVEIMTRWGQGYQLTPASKDIIKEALERRAES